MINTLSINRTDLTLEKVNIFTGENRRAYLDAIGMLAAAAGGVVNRESLIRHGVHHDYYAFNNRIGITTENGKYNVILSANKKYEWLFKGEYFELNGVIYVDRFGFGKKTRGKSLRKLYLIPNNRDAYLFFDELLRYKVIDVGPMCYRGLESFKSTIELAEKVLWSHDNNKDIKEKIAYLDNQLRLLFEIGNSIIDVKARHNYSDLRLVVAFLLIVFHGNSPYLALDGLNFDRPELAEKAIDLIAQTWSGGQLFISMNCRYKGRVNYDKNYQNQRVSVIA